MTTANMAGFDVICFIQLMRAQTLQELAKMYDQPLELPEMPSIVTTGDRLYETNLRSILRYLKQVYKTCKRQGAAHASVEVLAHRAMVKQFHDVNDWAGNLLMTLEAPSGVKGLVDGDITAQDLREFLNSADAQISQGVTRSEPSASDPSLAAEDPITDGSIVIQTPEVCGISRLARIEYLLTTRTQASDNESTIFEFQGNKHGDSPELRPPTKLREFGFRHVSLPLLPALHPDARLDSSSTRRVSLPLLANDQQSLSFLELSGETLQEFIRGVEVSPDKLDNKNRWLDLVQTPDAVAFLGRSPTAQKLKQFMALRGLEWVVRVRGKWNHQSNAKMLEKGPLRPAMPVRESAVVDEITSDRTSTEAPSIDVASNITSTNGAALGGSPFGSIALYDTSVSKEPAVAEQKILEDASHADTVIFEPGSPPEKLLAEESSTEQLTSNLAHVFPWLNSDAEKEATRKPAVIAPVASELACTSGDDSHNLTHVFVWRTPCYTDSLGEADNLEPGTDPADDTCVGEEQFDEQLTATNENLSLVEEEPASGNACHDLDIDEICAPNPAAHISEWSARNASERPFIDRPVVQEPIQETVQIEQPIFETSTSPSNSHACVQPHSFEGLDLVKTDARNISAYESLDGTLDHIFVFQKSHAPNSSASAGDDHPIEKITRLDSFETTSEVHVGNQEQAINTSEDDPSDKKKLYYLAEETAIIDLEDPSKKILTEDAVQPVHSDEAVEHSIKPDLHAGTDRNTSLISSSKSHAGTAITAKDPSPSPHSSQDEPPVLTPWSLTPILAGAAASAFIVSAFCPALSATMLWASVIYTKNKLRY
ncbi:hypothetical protein CLCR_04589 [Cladophialophora carrionii]|uniref:Uncharacterized protein n=1 Tax=Cladophialophora carrionii TaxID=86049 RepID=A0A1C1CLR5_9EURO|nr:hypothetical protein CLCR_04589 [Cladophialophora carrionii]